MNRLFRKESANAAVMGCILIIMAAAPIIVSVLFPLSAAVFALLTIICVFEELGSDKSPFCKLGTVVPMMLFPINGWLFRLVFSYGSAAKQLGKRIKEVFTDAPVLTNNDDKLVKFLCTKGFPVLCSEDAEYYSFGDMMFSDMLKYINSAEKSIFLEFFIVAEGSALNELTAALAGRAAAGADVRIIIDGAGSAFTKPRNFISRMKELGIQVREFCPLSPAALSVVNTGDHRKILVVDGITAFCGGINIADEYFNRKVRFGIWKDGGIRVSGNAAGGFEKMFLQMWAMTGNEAFIQPESSEQHGGISVQPFADVPLNGCRVSLEVYLNIIGRAEKYLYITTPYLVCDDEIFGALCTAAQCGVDVKLILPGIPDKKYVNIITKSRYEKLINHGVHIYEYRNGFIHCKNIICDGKLAASGTVNLDYRSFAENFECGCVIYDRDLTEKMKRDIDATLADCSEIDTASAGKGSAFVKIARIFLELFAPLM